MTSAQYKLYIRNEIQTEVSNACLSFKAPVLTRHKITALAEQAAGVVSFAYFNLKVISMQEFTDLTREIYAEARDAKLSRETIPLISPDYGITR